MPTRPVLRLLFGAILLWAPLLWWGGSAQAPIGCAASAADPGVLLGYVASGGMLANPALQQPAPAVPPASTSIVIDAVARRLYVLAEGKLIRTFPVAVGTRGTPTPLGHWQVKKKAVWGGPFGARWMQLSIPWGTYGIHGTDNPGSIGHRASHGCIRMYNRDVVQLYAMVQVGTPVTIRGKPVARFGEVRRAIVPSLLGSDIVQLQTKLQQLGLYSGPIDGVYRRPVVAAVRAFQEQHGLRPTGVIEGPTYDRLGLRPLAEDPSLAPGPPPGETTGPTAAAP